MVDLMINVISKFLEFDCDSKELKKYIRNLVIFYKGVSIID